MNILLEFLKHSPLRMKNAVFLLRNLEELRFVFLQILIIELIGRVSFWQWVLRLLLLALSLIIMPRPSSLKIFMFTAVEVSTDFFNLEKLVQFEIAVKVKRE